MDIVALFCDLDDFWRAFEPAGRDHLLPAKPAQRPRRATLSLSEILTLLGAFHRSGFRTFNGCYPQYVHRHLRAEFPQLGSYTRFVALLWPPALFFLSRVGVQTHVLATR